MIVADTGKSAMDRDIENT